MMLDDHRPIERDDGWLLHPGGIAPDGCAYPELWISCAELEAALGEGACRWMHHHQFTIACDKSAALRHMGKWHAKHSNEEMDVITQRMVWREFFPR